MCGDEKQKFDDGVEYWLNLPFAAISQCTAQLFGSRLVKLFWYSMELQWSSNFLVQLEDPAKRRPLILTVEIFVVRSCLLLALEAPFSTCSKTFMIEIHFTTIECLLAIE